MRVPVRAVRRQRTPAGDDGISLLEVIIALMIIAVVMTSAAGFFLHSLKTTGGAASRQTAVDVTNQELENIRAVPAGSLLTGRTKSSVQTLLAWPGAATLTAYDDINGVGGVQNYDPQATDPNGAAVPAITTQTVNNQMFTLHNFIDPCWLPVGTGATASTAGLACGANPTPPAGKTTSVLFRVTVAASWIGGAATDCTNGCTYSASTLVDPHGDPQFQSNISHPTITSINPSSIATGTTATLTVHGAGFKFGATVTTCGNAIVNSVDPNISDNILNVTVTAGSTTGSCSLMITNPDGGNTGTGMSFNIDSPPTFTGASPSVRNYTSGTVTVTGTNFASPTVLPASGTWTTTSSNTTTVVGTYAANAPAAGAVPITITNSDGGQATGSIAVTKSSPQLTLVTSATVTGGSLSTVTITGTDLAPSGATPTVTSGSVSNVTANGSSVSFTYTAPATAGTTTVTVTNPDTGAASLTLTVTAAVNPLVIASVSTTSQYFGGGFAGWLCSIFTGVKTSECWTVTYTVTGSNFGYAPTVSLSRNGGAFQQVAGSFSGSPVTFSQTYTTDPTGQTYTVQVSGPNGTSSRGGTVASSS